LRSFSFCDVVVSYCELLLELLSLHAICFDMLCSHFHLSHDTFQLNFFFNFFLTNLWLCWSSLLDFYIFVNFLKSHLLLIFSFFTPVVRKHTRCGFNLFKCVKPCLAACHAAYIRRSSVCAGEEGVLCFHRMDCSVYICWVHLV
jgi:hypothetical protein